MNILISAYKIENNKGSEDASGYGIIKALIEKKCTITLITRKNNADKLKKDPFFKDVTIIGLDVYKSLGFYKKKNRGIILYYYTWQILVGRKINNLRKKHQYNVIHHLNFHATWAPHFISRGREKIIWGPIAHHKDIPYAYWKEGLLNFFLVEIPNRIAKRFFWYCNPYLKKACINTDVILFANDDSVYPFTSFPEKIKKLIYAASDFSLSTTEKSKERFNILFTGRFVSLKNPLLVQKAFEIFCSKYKPSLPVYMTFIGSGPLARLLKKTDNINVINWLSRQELDAYYNEAHLFVFPSFESQGLVVAEALSKSCPVVCLENTGPHAVAAEAAVTVSFDPCADILAEKIAEKINDMYEAFTVNHSVYKEVAHKAFLRAQELEWSYKADFLWKIYNER